MALARDHQRGNRLKPVKARVLLRAMTSFTDPHKNFSERLPMLTFTVRRRSLQSSLGYNQVSIYINHHLIHQSVAQYP